MLGPGWPEQDPAAVAEFVLRGVDRFCDLVGGGHGQLVAHLDVDEHLRQPLDNGCEFPQRPPGRGHPGHQLHCGEQPITGRRVLPEDHVAALLAAQGQILPVELLKNVPVPDRGGVNRDPVRPHGVMQAQVAHHGRHDGVLP